MQDNASSRSLVDYLKDKSVTNFSAKSIATAQNLLNQFFSVPTNKSADINNSIVIALIISEITQSKLQDHKPISVKTILSIFGLR